MSFASRKLGLVGGTVADVYTGTWIRANVEIDGGRIVYVGPREPSGDVIDVSGKVVAPGYIEPHTHPWCLYSPSSLLEVAVPDGTTTLVYDNLFFFLAHGVDGLRSIVDAMNEAPAHVKWVARISPQSAYEDEAERFAIARIAPLFEWPEVVASSWITKGVIDNFLDVDGFATTATTSLELLVLGRDPAAMARAAGRVAEMGGGFAFDGGWSAPLEIDGLIAAGGFDRALAIEQELSEQMQAHGYPFHDPLYSLLFASGDFLPEVRLTPRGVLEVKTRTVLAPAQRLA